MTVPDAVSNLFVESLKLSAKQRTVLDVINEHPRGITAARIATIMGTTVNTLRGHLDELLAQEAIRAEAPNVGSRGRPALVYYSRVPSPWNTSPWCGFLPNIYWKPPTTRGLSPTILAVPGRGKYPRSHATNQNSWFGWPKWVSTRSPSRSRTTWQTPNWPRHQLNSRMCLILRHQGRQKRQMGPPQATPTMLAARSLNYGPAHFCTRTRTLPPPYVTFTWVCLPPERAPTDGVSHSRRIMVMSSVM